MIAAPASKHVMGNDFDAIAGEASGFDNVPRPKIGELEGVKRRSRRGLIHENIIRTRERESISE